MPYIFSSNIYSCKIFENTGFTKEGTLKEHFYKYGMLYDAHIYGPIAK